MSIINSIQESLFANQDLEYQKFNARLIPNIKSSKIIGVRLPAIRKIAKIYVNNKDIEIFLNNLPHQYQEENILHSIIISECQDYNKLIKYLDIFLPYLDNWVITDTLKPNIVKKNSTAFYQYLLLLLKNDSEYIKRYAIVSLLTYYLDDFFRVEELEILSKIETNYFYVNMALAWFYSFALIKQYEVTIPYFEKGLLNPWVHNKSLQKAIESYRITDYTKEYLRSLKINVKKNK
jgi:3-methyladenine DNA glycosylase AlkD